MRFSLLVTLVAVLFCYVSWTEATTSMTSQEPGLARSSMVTPSSPYPIPTKPSMSTESPSITTTPSSAGNTSVHTSLSALVTSLVVAVGVKYIMRH